MLLRANWLLGARVCVCAFMCVRLCVCVCACVCKRERVCKCIMVQESARARQHYNASTRTSAVQRQHCSRRYNVLHYKCPVRYIHIYTCTHTRQESEHYAICHRRERSARAKYIYTYAHVHIQSKRASTIPRTSSQVSRQTLTHMHMHLFMCTCARVHVRGAHTTKCDSKYCDLWYRMSEM